ncbi:MAG: hypothetical protein MRJ68_22000, partial [Nitrospira sp.]|nr:hypothetical protein [Nitrospira sp.]
TKLSDGHCTTGFSNEELGPIMVSYKRLEPTLIDQFRAVYKTRTDDRSYKVKAGQVQRYKIYCGWKG